MRITAEQFAFFVEEAERRIRRRSIIIQVNVDNLSRELEDLFSENSITGVDPPPPVETQFLNYFPPEWITGGPPAMWQQGSAQDFLNRVPLSQEIIDDLNTLRSDPFANLGFMLAYSFGGDRHRSMSFGRTVSAVGSLLLIRRTMRTQTPRGVSGQPPDHAYVPPSPVRRMPAPRPRLTNDSYLQQIRQGFRERQSGRQQAVPPRIRESTGASPRGSTFQSASAQTARSTNTAIRADVAEAEAYKEALRRGEIGLQRPQGANVIGTDFISAAPNAQGVMEVIVTDVKMSTIGRFPAPRSTVPPAWVAEVQAAVAPGRLNLNDPILEQQIRNAVAAGRIRSRQLNANYSPAGQGRITGF